MERELKKLQRRKQMTWISGTDAVDSDHQKDEWDTPDKYNRRKQRIGFIMSDIDDRGAEGFLNMTAQEVVHKYIGATVTVSQRT